jgi:hypothetical protein
MTRSSCRPLARAEDVEGKLTESKIRRLSKSFLTEIEKNS